jgi:type II secretory pathway component GspD/PulD (secretin)
MDKFKIGLPMQQGVSGFVIDGALSQGRMSVDMLVDALATEGEVRTLSSPRMVVANNEEAKIIEGKNEPYKEISKDVQGNSIESWKFIEVGIGMTVTPHVFEDSVELTVHPQISQSERTGGYEVAPVVVKSDLQTTVRVKDGATLVLGGLIQEKKNKTTVGIPYLMKIPFLGRLFSKKNNYDERYEIVFFITPTILK